MRAPLTAWGCIHSIVQGKPQGIEMWYLALQAEALTLPVVVSRLINTRRHWLALQISSLLGMGPEKVRSVHCLLQISGCIVGLTYLPLHLGQTSANLFTVAECMGAGKGHLRLAL